MKIGDKVVCVDDSPCSICGKKHSLIKSSVYVVSAVRGFLDSLGSVGVKCIGAACHNHNNSTGFLSSLRFRLLDELKAANKRQLAQAGHL
jgi:hypothetical protein